MHIIIAFLIGMLIRYMIKNHKQRPVTQSGLPSHISYVQLVEAHANTDGKGGDPYSYRVVFKTDDGCCKNQFVSQELYQELLPQQNKWGYLELNLADGGVFAFRDTPPPPDSQWQYLSSDDKLRAAVIAGDPALLPEKQKKAYSDLLEGSRLWDCHSTTVNMTCRDLEGADILPLFIHSDALPVLRVDPTIRRFVQDTYNQALKKALESDKRPVQVTHKESIQCHGNRFALEVRILGNLQPMESRIELRFFVNPT